MPVHEAASPRCSLQAASSAILCLVENTPPSICLVHLPVFASNSRLAPLPVQIVRCPFFFLHFLVSPFARTDPGHRDNIGALILSRCPSSKLGRSPLPSAAASIRTVTKSSSHCALAQQSTAKHSKAQQSKAAQHSTACVLRTASRQPAHKPP